MVRKKSAPSQKDATEQRQVTWNLNNILNSESSTNSHQLNHDETHEEQGNDLLDLINDEEEEVLLESLSEDDDESDVEYKPPKSTVRKPGQNSSAYKPKPKNRAKQKIDYGAFEDILKNSAFNVKIVKNSRNVHCLLGYLELEITNFDESILDNCNLFWLYVSHVSSMNALYFESNNSTSSDPFTFRYFIVDELDFKLWEAANCLRYFQLVLGGLNGSKMSIGIYLLKQGLLNIESPSDYFKGNNFVSYIASHFLGLSPRSFEGKLSLRHDINKLFQFIKEYHKGKHYASDNVQHPSLIPLLRPYQKAAVKWMVYQERTSQNSMSKDKLHPLYVEANSLDGVPLYFNIYGNFFVSSKPLCVESYPGGILADEMGLGKTVEVLACMLCNPRKNISKPLYQEAIIPKVRGKFRHKVDPSNNIYTVEASDNNFKKLNYSNQDVKNKQSPNKSPYKIKVHLPRRISSSDEEDDQISSHYSPIQSQNNGNNEGNNGNGDDILIPNGSQRDRNSKRMARRKLQISDSEEDYEEYKPKKSKPSENKYNPDREIQENTHLNSIEKVILEHCWSGSTKDYKKDGSYKEFRKFLRQRKKDPFYMMTLKERLNLQYNNSIAEYSATLAARSVVKDFFELKVEQKSYFECMCGQRSGDDDDLYKIQCTVCSLWQHADCVQFDVSDPYRGEYICPHCWVTQEPIASGATLIVTPSSISYQWVDEILKHIKEKSIRMLVYNGVSSHGYIQPRTLASFDIVITTYETLRKEVNYVDLPHSNSEAGRKFRYAKRFMAAPSPLPSVEWWRICLDEAQMAECRATKAAEMAVRLSAINRWCVTGTPIQKSVNNLQGLLFFLGVDPYWVPQWWQRCLYDPYCHGSTDPLHNVISKYMWRNSKKDVEDEIEIPEQTSEVHWLNFTPVEEHFYRRLHVECSTEALQRLSKFEDSNIKLCTLDRQSVSSLLQPLLKLRQACNHPQVVKGHFMSLNRKKLTMEHLLENLIKKTQVEAEDAHRFLVGALNGLAALHIIRDGIPQAVDMYRNVLNSVEEHNPFFKTDSLQRLHTIHNLAEVLSNKHDGVASTLRDGNLTAEAKEIKDDYLKQYPLRIADSLKECKDLTNSILELTNKFNHKTDWWMSALESFTNNFVEEVRDNILSEYTRFEEKKCILYPVKTRTHLVMVLRAEMTKIKSQRKDMIKGIENLMKVDPYSILNRAISCHLRPLDDEPSNCILCSTHEYFEDYEESLFFMKDISNARITEKSKETEDVKEKAQILLASRKGNWSNSDIERVLRYLQTKSLAKVDSLVYEDSQTHFEVLNAMKKEFKHYRILWRAIFDQVSAIDEVNMATLRYRLRFPDEELPKFKDKKDKNDLEKKTIAPTYIFDECELPHLDLKLRSDKIVYENELRVKKGQLLYLKNLQKADFGRRGGLNPEPCPVCQGKLGEKWAVMQCGHSYCIDCMGVLTKRALQHERGSIKCPICRQSCRAKDISFVDTHFEEEDEEIKIQGSLSTKMEGIVRTMLKIKASDPQSKVLIFSSWNDALEVIGDALAQNGITYRCLHANNNFQENLAAFKTNQEITTLLLPISSGANGLNLIQARYVLLVDPILNPAAELQALGRVHRIGQTKTTVVHRFLVRSTIEERMHTILSPHAQEISTDENPVTIGDLCRLFSDQNEGGLDVTLNSSNSDLIDQSDISIS